MILFRERRDIVIIERLSSEEIAKGYQYDDHLRQYTCLDCDAIFREGEVYPTEDGRFLLPQRAAEEHCGRAHGNRLVALLESDSKYISLTENQRQLLKWMAMGQSDREIATALQVAPSTIRHQRFSFREKAKQAKMYLAIYELATEKGIDELMEVHNDTVKVDDRFVITEEERQKIIKGAFASTEPLRLLRIPPKEKKKIVVMNLISAAFEKGKIYTEKEVNGILKEIYEDNVTLRRYLIEYGYMDRKKDCSEYWVK